MGAATQELLRKREDFEGIQLRSAESERIEGEMGGVSISNFKLQIANCKLQIEVRLPSAGKECGM
jgi:hypothetical protein